MNSYFVALIVINAILFPLAACYLDRCIKLRKTFCYTVYAWRENGEIRVGGKATATPLNAFFYDDNLCNFIVGVEWLLNEVLKHEVASNLSSATLIKKGKEIIEKKYEQV